MRYAAVIFLALVLAGCESPVKERHTFVLDVERAEMLAGAENELVLRVNRFSALSPFKYKDLVYRKSDLEYETDYYYQFLIQPEDMVMRQVYDWFSDAGMFGNVLRWDDTLEATHAINGYITLLYGDFSDESSFKAVMEVEFTLVDLRGDKPQRGIEKTYHAEMAFDSREASSLIHGYGQCLEEIMAALEMDVAAKSLQ